MEPSSKYSPELKVVDGPQGLIEGWGIPFGGPIAGGDVDGEFFSAKTDFRFDWFPDGRPMLYDHGTDKKLGLDLIGRQTEHQVVDEIGVWVKGQINMSHRYAEAVMGLIGEQKIGFSSLAMRHLVEKERNGHIKTWPWIEETLTVRPANPVATIEEFKMAATPADHMKALGLDVPEALTVRSEKAIDLPVGMSTEDLRDALLVAIKAGYPSIFDVEDQYAYVDVVYDGTMVASIDSRYYEVTYTLNDGEVTVTDSPRAVVRRTVWEPEAKQAPEALWAPPEKATTFMDLADTAKASLSDVVGFIGSAETLVEALREKEEQLTDSKRVVLDSLCAGVEAASKQLTALLEQQGSAAPAPTHAPSWRLRLADVGRQMRELQEV